MGTLRLWNLRNGESLGEMRGHSNRVMCVSVEWSLHRALSGSYDRTLCLWDLETCSRIKELKGDATWVICVAVNWVAQLSVSGSYGSILHVWDLQRGQILQELRGHDGPVLCLEADWASRRAISGSEDQTIRVWNLTTGVDDAGQGPAIAARVLRGHQGNVQAMSVDWLSNSVLSGSRDSTLRLWDLESGLLIREFW